MKSKLIIIAACLAVTYVEAAAQTQYEAARFSGNELNGTARFVGMGGAMGALGADISVMGTNPAGIGLFRGHDASLSFGFNATSTEAVTSPDYTMSDKRTRASFDQIGFVYSSKIGNRTSLRYLNFGFNYHKSKNFNRLFSAADALGGLSQTQQMANMMYGFSSGVIDDIYNYNGGVGDPYRNPDYPYLGVMGVRTDLVSVDANSGQPIGWGGDQYGYRSREEGGINQYDFNISFNVEDRMFFGLTLGVYDINYKRSTYYTEDVYDGAYGGFYEMENFMHTDGSGWDLKLGAIFRPIESSPFRFGLAVHTPTWYNLTDIYSARIHSELSLPGVDEHNNAVTDYVAWDENSADYADGEVLQDYQLSTPWKFNFSMGTTLGGMMALGAEYELATYASSRLRYNDGYEMVNQNQYISDDLKTVHTLRLGMESYLLPSFCVRAGYNFSTSIFRKEAYKALEMNDMRTDVEYSNDFNRNTVTLGLGYRGKMFYADLAYKYDIYKSDFYVFSADDLSPAKLNNERHQLLFTMGVHF